MRSLVEAMSTTAQVKWSMMYASEQESFRMQGTA